MNLAQHQYSATAYPPRSPVGLCVSTLGAVAGGVNVRTIPGFFVGAEVPAGEAPAPPEPARILASLSATEEPMEAPDAFCGAGVGAAVFRGGCTGG